ncbi:putative helicase domain-containing protein [Magnetofaba australis IT-1]|uniref:Putative helicase domain-containing protein n=2 Tax=Magnetofaba TaxID=1472292 RepID=A0A1Y2KAE0_9PROT|nr:putative helicase domain-containing protein [Magnetofaba australis IT-1]
MGHELISFISTASRIADTLTHDVLLAPIESSVIPLPHQIHALTRAMSGDRVRYLLADEVGLGKTIEAGLIIRELKLRGLARRVLVLAPKGLVTQWVAEMKGHFNEDFRLLMPSDFAGYRRIAGEENPWRTHHQVICPMDSVKPLEKRRGWSRAQVAEYNHDRFDSLVAAGWDLIIVDEAHRMGGSTDQVARFRLGQGLAEAAPYLLLLSATPHQGKSDAFHRLLTLLDMDQFPSQSSVTRERVAPYVIRTEKRHAIDAEGKPLFRPRQTQLFPVAWEARHQRQKALYEAISDYVRLGYNQAMRQKRNAIGFLLILMQRLVTSSTSAIRTTLERRLEALKLPNPQLSLLTPEMEEEWGDMDGQELLENLMATRVKGIRNERAEVQMLLDAARQCEEAGPDAKAETLLDRIYTLQQEENDPDLKVLIFTEFVPTQEMLRQFLEDRGFPVVCLNGALSMEERKAAQLAFAQERRILISTDAGGEGLNLQFCHVVINYDIPWNPMRLEQRIGRVDRIGQPHVVRAINFVFEETVEYRVQEVLEEKLEVIRQEFGIDKTGDVLDSAQTGELFDDLHVDAILHPEKVEPAVDEMVNRIREGAVNARETESILAATRELDPGDAQRMISHPLPHWVERMTVSYLRAHGGDAQRTNSGWRLQWPGEKPESGRFVFSTQESMSIPTASHLTLEDPRIRSLASRLPRFIPGQPIPVVQLPGIPDGIEGTWSLWRIAIQDSDGNRQRIMPLFVHDDGRALMPTAKRIWDQLMAADASIQRHMTGDDAASAFHKVESLAEQHGHGLWQELQESHRERIAAELVRGEYAFSMRRQSIERLGLPEVKNHRLRLLEQEEESWRSDLASIEQILPEMTPLLIVRMHEGDAHG